ncbi:chromosome segregation protein SMC [Rubrivirga sp. S365]|uniref:Chromosome partition protein Smc n=1 Tax=Rubrivirga litoralis TaxID=3075598 RepID=A0ABU3BNQ3_9BACT|nr:MULTISPECIES: chromosome segregation protein SMC [unclassified Rubrivirga]MDT0630926.1 chromosome segregation protein SMC [Rubrivirga sp. F394]MDT7856569.1 chromosome segregation protein SMC [Rubrivirga sp. S365]
MYLSRLELHGFKSFAQKTAVSFSPGVTAIVGPNGCGKSNVIDAVRWVLGEQRARLLRSESMSGVIFNGAAEKRALGMAEVSLTVENNRGVLPTEYAEVTVTRRLYRNGDSDYLLNGTVVRLRDVLDLFMDTGMGAGAYSVIELSMVEDILSENADDRRRLFEEAAGVTKYKRRRAQALRRLDATRADLTRLDDIVEEVEKQVRSLSRQAQKAARHERLAGRLRRIELALAAHDVARLQTERDALDASTRAQRTEAEGLGAQLAGGEADLEAARAALVDREGEMADRARALQSHAETVQRLEAEARVAAERRDAARRALDRIAREREADKTRARNLDAERERAAAQIEAAEGGVVQTQAALDAAQAARAEAADRAAAARQALQSARADAGDAARALREAQSARDRAADRRAFLEADRERAQSARAALAAPPADGAAPPEAAPPEAAPPTPPDDLEAAEAELERAGATLAERVGARDAARAAFDAAQGALQEARTARNTARAELDLLRAFVASGEGAGGAVAFLRAQAGWTAPTVADVVGADEADRPALDAALGAYADALVVGTAREAEAAVRALRDADEGRATFFVLDRVKAPAPPAAPPGAVRLLDRVRVSETRFEPLLAALLGDVFLVDALPERAPRAGRLVTPDGAWADGRAVHGGSPATQEGAGRFGARERQDRAAEALDAAERALASAESAAADARDARDRAEADRADAERARDAAREDRDAARSVRARAAAAEAAREAEAAARRAEAARLDQRVQEITDALGALPAPPALDAAVAEAEGGAETAEAARARAEAAADDAAREGAAAEAAWSDARLAHARAQSAVEAARADRDRAARSLDEVARRQAERAAEAERLEAGLATGDADDGGRGERIGALRRETDALQTAAADAERAVLDARARIADGERALRDLRAARERVTTALADAERRLVEIATRQETTLERLADEHGTTLDDATDELDRLGEEAPFEPAAARAEVPTLKEKIRALGAVNSLALESYEEEQDRLETLTAQRADLAGAEASLLETIREINETARRRFDETFGAVREAFQKIFADLFGGDAAADVRLDGDDPLEAPVAITARPKGKRPVSLAQLSGGEKTLTATALLFAIYLVKPSPFCILDEVDAPLDDANVGRFMRLIRSFADSTQFILVTHNKLTMEAADRMYGVTMPTPGVSRLVGVRFDGGDGAEVEAEPA